LLAQPQRQRHDLAQAVDEGPAGQPVPADVEVDTLERAELPLDLAVC
jgi:hypothetical protein